MADADRSAVQLLNRRDADGIIHAAPEEDTR